MLILRINCSRLEPTVSLVRQLESLTSGTLDLGRKWEHYGFHGLILRLQAHLHLLLRENLSVSLR